MGNGLRLTPWGVLPLLRHGMRFLRRDRVGREVGTHFLVRSLPVRALACQRAVAHAFALAAAGEARAVLEAVLAHVHAVARWGGLLLHREMCGGGAMVACIIMGTSNVKPVDTEGLLNAEIVGPLTISDGAPTTTTTLGAASAGSPHDHLFVFAIRRVG